MNVSDANRLGLDYLAASAGLPYRGPIRDVHSHINDAASAGVYLRVADAFGIGRTWTMTQLEKIDEIREAHPGRFDFIAVPNHEARDTPGTFTTDWYRRIEGFAAKGVKLCKFWAAPRGLDMSDELGWIDAPHRRVGMDLARDAGMMFMTHVGDPDTWFQTKYSDTTKYGTKDDHYDAFRRVLDRYGDVTWIAAHMAGSPEDLERVQGLLDDYPNLYIDTSAAKWMVREVSRHPEEVAAFLRGNVGRVMFGSDIVTNPENMHADWGGGQGGVDLYASRYWSLRTLWETSYQGPSPIVDPDLTMVDPSLDEKSTAAMHGLRLDEATLRGLYHDAAARVLG